MSEPRGYRPIEDYEIIGDLHTVALVSMDGSIDWRCLPHFDSPSVFAAILDSRKGGYFRIAPVDPPTVKQMYVPETNVLVTRFLSPDGVGECVDFMPIAGQERDEMSHDIVRQVKAGSLSWRGASLWRPAIGHSEGRTLQQLSLLTLLRYSKKPAAAMHRPYRVGIVACLSGTVSGTRVGLSDGTGRRRSAVSVRW